MENLTEQRDFNQLQLSSRDALETFCGGDKTFNITDGHRIQGLPYFAEQRQLDKFLLPGWKTLEAGSDRNQGLWIALGHSVLILSLWHLITQSLF